MRYFVDGNFLLCKSPLAELGHHFDILPATCHDLADYVPIDPSILKANY
jgi:hypothetical protein